MKTAITAVLVVAPILFLMGCTVYQSTYTPAYSNGYVVSSNYYDAYPSTYYNSYSPYYTNIGFGGIDYWGTRGWYRNNWHGGWGGGWYGGHFRR